MLQCKICHAAVTIPAYRVNLLLTFADLAARAREPENIIASDSSGVAAPLHPARFAIAKNTY
jgi:hypothetical protein